MHALDRQLGRVRDLAATLDVDFNMLPLFPDRYGGEVDRAQAVGTINALATCIGVPIKDELGALLFGGHSLRTGGAHMLSSRGVNPFKIQAMGRWRSPLVIHYAGAAMATNIAADLGAGSGPAQASAASEFATFASIIESRIAALETPDPVLLRPPTARGHRGEGSFVTNSDTHVVHWSEVSKGGCHTAQKSLCGWFYLARRYTRSDTLPVGTNWKKVCDRCLPDERSALKLADCEEASELD